MRKNLVLNINKIWVYIKYETAAIISQDMDKMRIENEIFSRKPRLIYRTVITVGCIIIIIAFFDTWYE